MSLTKDQQTILDKIVDSVSESYYQKDTESRMFSITGNAGTGKSYLTSKIATALDEKYISVKLTAPTHKAAAVLRELITGLEVSTIHSHLCLKVTEDTNTGVRSLSADRDFKPGRADVLLVDEFSMIDNELFQHIIRFLNTGYVKYVVFIGDHYQLPPVNNEFSILDEVPIENQMFLYEILRQAADNPVIQLSAICVDHIKKAKSKQSLINEIIAFGTHEQIKYYNQKEEFFEAFIADQNDNSVILSYTNNAVYQNNKIARIFKKGENIPDYVQGDRLIFQDMYKLDSNTFQNNQEVVVKKSTLAKDAKYDVNYWNLFTDCGKVKAIAGDSLTHWNDIIKRMANDAVIEKDNQLRRQKWAMYFRIKKKFADTKLHYSSTIHKSQGSTYPNVYLDLTAMNYLENNIFCRLAYVGITRTSNQLHLLSHQSSVNY